jgi:predicted nucleic-acid-binding protein
MITIDTNIVVRYLIKDDEIFVGRVTLSLTRPTNFFPTASYAESKACREVVRLRET